MLDDEQASLDGDYCHEDSDTLETTRHLLLDFLCLDDLLSALE